MDVETVVRVGLGRGQDVGDRIAIRGRVSRARNCAGCAVDVRIGNRRDRGFLAVDGELAAVGLGLISPSAGDLCGRDLRADVGASGIRAREFRIHKVADRLIQLVVHGHIAFVGVGLRSAVVNLVDILERDLRFLLDGSDVDLRRDLLLAHAALQRDGEFADAVHLQNALIRIDRCRCASADAPVEDARAVGVCGVIAVRIELDYVTVVDGVRAGAALRQAVDIEIDVGLRALLGVLALLIGDGVVLRERVDRLNCNAADLIEGIVAVVGLAARRVIEEFRRDLHVAERGVRRCVASLRGKTRVACGHVGEGVVLRGLPGVCLDGQSLLCNGEALGDLVRGVVRGLVHVQRDGVRTGIDRRLLVNIAFLLDVVADGHIARVGEVGLRTLCSDIRRSGVAVLRHGVVGQAGSRGDVNARVCLGDCVDAVGHIARGGRDLHQITSRAGRTIGHPTGASLILELCQRCAVGEAGLNALVLSRAVQLRRVADGDQRAGLRGNCGSIAGRVTNGDLQRDAALVVVLLRTDDHGVETLFVGIVDLLDLRVGVQIVEHIVACDLVAGLIDHVDRVRRELLACLERHIGRGNAVDLAAADIDVLRVLVVIPHVVRRVVAAQLDRGDGEAVVTGIRAAELRLGRHSVDAVAVDDADIVGRQTRAVRGLIGHGVVQHDLNDADIGGAVVDLGLRDGVRNGDAALFNGEVDCLSLLRPVGGSGERDHGLVGTGLCRLDRVAIRVLIADGPGLVRGLIDARALEVEAIERDRQTLCTAVVGHGGVGRGDAVAALADDQAAGDLLRRVTGVGRGADRQGVEAGDSRDPLVVALCGVPAKGVPAVDGVHAGEGLLIGGVITLRAVVRDLDGDVRVRHCADHAGEEHIRGDGLALGDALGVLGADLAGVERDGDGHVGVRRHQDVGIVDLTAVVCICRTDHALVKLIKGALGDRLVLHGDDRTIGSVLLDLVKNEGRAGRAVNIHPVLGSAVIATGDGGCAVQLLPLDGVVRSRIQLGDGVEQSLVQITIQRVDIAQCKRGLFIGLECAVAHADVDALVAVCHFLLVLVLAVEDHGGVDGDVVIFDTIFSRTGGNGAISCIVVSADVEGIIALVDGGDFNIAPSVGGIRDRKLVRRDAGGHAVIGILGKCCGIQLDPVVAVLVVEGDGAGGLHRSIGTLGCGYRCRQGDLIELIDVGRSSRLDGIEGLDSHGDVLLGADDGILRGRLAAREHALTGQLDAVAVADLGGRGGIGRLRALIVGLDEVVAGLILPLDVVVLCRNGTAVERDHGVVGGCIFTTGGGL